MNKVKLSRNEDITSYSHDTQIDEDTYSHTHRDVTETSKCFADDRYRFRHCTEHKRCNKKVLIYGDNCAEGERLENIPFIQFTCPEMSFGYISNHGYGSGYNVFYLLALSYKIEDRDYSLAELLKLVEAGDLTPAYGGMSEIYRAHTMTRSTYLSYATATWCEGGCGGCIDNWDYIDPFIIYEIFPTYEDMENYKDRCLNFLRCHIKSL